MMKPYSKHAVQTLCGQNGISLKKRWGQNFLIHEKTCADIAAAALSLCKNQTEEKISVWEIGPGLGALTCAFLAAPRVASVRAFEIDRGLCRTLEGLYAEDIASGRFAVREGDAERTLAEDAAREAAPALLCGNLPYSSGVRILLSAVQQPALRVPACVMLQKEAAARIAAAHGSKLYGISSVLLQSVYDIRMERTVARSFFYPYAHVDSAVCLLRPKAGNVFADEKLGEKFDDKFSGAAMDALFALVKSAFSARRKKLANTLVPFLRGVLSDDENAFKSAADNFDMNRRAEDVPPEEYCALARRIVPQKNSAKN